MEEEDWAWADDEDIRLDGESPLVISLSLWDDFASNDVVARSLFPSSDVVKPAFPFEEPDCSPPPLKRRCRDKDAIKATPASSAWGENKSCSLVAGVENLESNGLSTSTWMCFTVIDELPRSIVDVEEQSAESWMAGCIGESNPSDVQEILTPQYAYAPIDTPVMTDKASGKMQSKGQAAKKLVNVNEKAIKGTLDRKFGPTNYVRESVPPVLAYPFELLKPSGIQGDVTLQDINHRINMVPSSPCACPNYKDSSRVLDSSSTISGKSVVALTTIQTEGKGTITIMRTRS